MINYSIVMRSVNANLFEINQAKSRINAAKAAGQSPAPEDEALVKTVKQNAYAIAQYSEVMTIEKFAKHITSHGCVYSRADIAAILYMAVDCMREQLLEGKKIRLGDLGDFSVALSSKGAETADKFSASNISAVSVNWEPGAEFKNLITDAEFNLVASRDAQAKLLKAIKAGELTVDFTNPDGDGGSDGGGSKGDEGAGTSQAGKKFTVTVSANPTEGGSVSGGGEFESGESTTIKAEPGEGFLFTRWSDGDSHATRTVTVTEDKTYVAEFGEDPNYI